MVQLHDVIEPVLAAHPELTDEQRETFKTAAAIMFLGGREITTSLALDYARSHRLLIEGLETAINRALERGDPAEMES